MLLPEKGPPLKHLRQKRHRAAAAVQDKHLSTGIIAKFGDNGKAVDGIVAGLVRVSVHGFSIGNPRCR
jgi:hypothetical protein